MSNSDDATLEQPTIPDEPSLKDVFAELVKIGKRLENNDARFEAINIQLEAIREGISHNASRFDRLESQVYSVRSDISALKADVRDLGEEIRREKLALK